MKIQYIVIFVIPIIFLRCADNNTNDSNRRKSEGSLLKGKKINFNLSDEVSTRFHHIQVFDSLIYCSDNVNYSSIYVFNLRGKLVDVMSFNKRGPNGVGRFRGFYIHDIDSIFIVNRYAYKLYLANSKGEVISKYDLKKKDIEIAALPTINPGSPMFKIGDNIYLPSVPELAPCKYNYEYNRSLIELNLNNNDVNYKLGYPQVLQKYSLHSAFSFIYSCYNSQNEKLIVSYPGDYRLYNYDIENELLQCVNNTKSHFVENIKCPTSSPSNDSYERNLFALQQDLFTSVYYDQYKNLYYRFMRKRRTKKDAKEFLQNPRQRNSKTDRYVMIYDKDFNLLLEKRIPFLKSSSEAFILPDGLYLKGNYENNENKVYFQQYIYRK